MRYYRKTCSDCDCFINQLPDEAFAQVRSKTFEPGEVLYTEGALMDRVMFVCEGTAQSFHVDTLKNEKQIQSFVQKGTLLGLQELMENNACWTHSVEVVESCQVLILDAEVFMASLSVPEVLRQVMFHSIQRKQSVQRQLVNSFKSEE